MAWALNVLLVSTRVLYESSRQAMIGPKSIYCCISGFRILLAKSALSMFLCLVRKAFALLLSCKLSLLVFELCAGHRQVDGLQDKFARWGGLTPSNPERIQLGKSIEHGCGTVVWQVNNHWGKQWHHHTRNRLSFATRTEAPLGHGCFAAEKRDLISLVGCMRGKIG